MATTVPLRPTGKPRTEKGTVHPFNGIELNYAIIEGKKPGPCLLITAGMHGSETCGIETARRLMRTPSEHINGVLAVLPILNVQGFNQHSIFVMPEDGKNLNRQFPGKKDGTVSERLAHWLVTSVYPYADAYLDLHSADLTEELTPFTLFVRDNAESRELSIAFGLPIAVQGDGGGYTVSGASDVGLPGIIVEIGGGGRWSEKEVTQMSEGIARVMEHLKMLVLPCDVGELSAEDARDWNNVGRLVAPVEAASPKVPSMVTMWVCLSPSEGFWHPDKKPGDTVKGGERLGQIQDVYGNTIATIRSQKAGIYLYGSTSLRIAKGETLFGIAMPVEG
ncbi:MAG: hypothetical protein L6R39_005675 [Caloplaca ligustica]|nr:MAG: hypothetical protein L6R39_005675 [Caloplaca ligustica]